MKISANGIKFIKQMEGWENKLYLDVAGLPTIGVGHLLTQEELTEGRILINGVNVDYSNGLNESQVQALLDQDLDEFENAVNGHVHVNLTQNEFDALVSFSFNVGVGAFRKSTLLRLLNEGKKNEVPGQLRRWVRSGGRKVQGLINRREDEIKLWNAEIKDERPLMTFTATAPDCVANCIEKNGNQVVQLIGKWTLI